MAQQFSKVLAANRGEIAIRIFRACHDLGLHTVAMYSNEDTNSMFRIKADEAYLIGENQSPLGAYLDIPAIIDLAKRRGVTAIHPGYGFLSENADFARACEANGIKFIGPPSQVLAQMGDKLAAKATAIACNVPIIPGSTLPLKNADEAVEKALSYGFPIILKAAGVTGKRVEEAYGVSSGDFLAQAKASNYVADYPFLEGVADDSLEGYLYPKTYSFTSTPTADQVIRAMLDQFELEVASLDFDSARATIKERYGVEMSDYDFINLASIVEREGLTAEQRGKVASTFYNRFEAGMPLQSDATMMYVTGGAVTADDLDQESPYNTYKNQGLPPTPICSPSLESIEATLNPPETDYLYFFITTEDEWFSETYDGHLAAIAENR